jgi:LacI family transcriptional regulator
MPRHISTSHHLIVLALDMVTESALALVEGVKEVSRGIRDWELAVLPGGYEATLRQLAAAGELHGAIGDFVSDAWLSEWQGGRIPVVQTAQISMLERAVNVTAPFVEMGRQAAYALRGNGCRTFAFVGPAGQFAAAQLEMGFREALGDAELHLARSSAAPMLLGFLRTLEPPVGLFAASDVLARQAVCIGREAGLSCPGDLAVIGVGDQRIESIHAGVALSSFEIPAREIGRRAAEALAAILRGEGPPPGIYPVNDSPVLHERASSLRRGSGLDRAVAFVRSRLAEPLQVDDFAREAGMSRRALEMAFRREFGTGPAAWLRSLRRERAETLLRTTQLGVHEIGSRCGYPEPAVFSSVFKQWTGQSPRAFRAASRG